MKILIKKFFTCSSRNNYIEHKFQECAFIVLTYSVEDSSSSDVEE